MLRQGPCCRRRRGRRFGRQGGGRVSLPWEQDYLATKPFGEARVALIFGEGWAALIFGAAPVEAAEAQGETSLAAFAAGRTRRPKPDPENKILN